MSPSSPDCPNIMAIRRRSLDTYAGLKGLASRDDSVLADKISRLIIWYSLQKRDLSDEDRNYLDTSLVGANSNPLAAGYIQEMVKTIRGLGGIAITSTQGMQDLFSLDNGKYGKGILDSSRIKIVMQMEEQEARLIQNVLNLSEEEVRSLTRFRRGEELLCIGYNHVPIAFYATQKEYDAITTSPTDLLNRNKK